MKIKTTSIESEKKEYEFQITEAFLQRINSTCRIENDEPPNPDIFLPDRNIGIELIRYMSPGDSAKDEGSLAKFIRRAEEKYRKQGGELSAHIWPCLPAVKGFHKKTWKEIEMLSDRVADFAMNKHGEFDFKYDTDSEFYGIIDGIDLFRDNYRTYWQAVRAGIITFQSEIIIDSIKKKNQKVPQYTKSHSQIWLLIYGTSGCSIGNPNKDDMFSATFKIEHDLIFTIPSSAFHRIFLMDSYGDVLDLK